MRKLFFFFFDFGRFSSNLLYMCVIVDAKSECKSKSNLKSLKMEYKHWINNMKVQETHILLDGWLGFQYDLLVAFRTTFFRFTFDSLDGPQYTHDSVDSAWYPSQMSTSMCVFYAFLLWIRCFLYIFGDFRLFFDPYSPLALTITHRYHRLLENRLKSSKIIVNRI